MGVDFYSCQRCGETFPDCGEYISCGECSTVWCSDECAELDGYKSDDEGDSVCNFCTGKDVKDYELIDFLLVKLGTSREEVVEEFNKTKTT